jgi:hypothetical protein
MISTPGAERQGLCRLSVAEEPAHIAPKRIAISERRGKGGTDANIIGCTGDGFDLGQGVTLGLEAVRMIGACIDSPAVLSSRYAYLCPQD